MSKLYANTFILNTILYVPISGHSTRIQRYILKLYSFTKAIVICKRIIEFKDRPLELTSATNKSKVSRNTADKYKVCTMERLFKRSIAFESVVTTECWEANCSTYDGLLNVYPAVEWQCCHVTQTILMILIPSTSWLVV